MYRKIVLFPIDPCTCASPFNHWAAQLQHVSRWQRAGSVTQDRLGERKAAPPTLLLELDEQLWSSHSLKLWDSGPKLRDLFQIGKSPEEDVSKADARRAHPGGARNRQRRALFERPWGLCSIPAWGWAVAEQNKSKRRLETEEWRATSHSGQ